jgi:hypothetical protein
MNVLLLIRLVETAEHKASIVQLMVANPENGAVVVAGADVMVVCAHTL